MSMRCVRCMIDFPEDKRLCTACGDSLVSFDETTVPFPRCAKCGSAVADSDRFCPGCGTQHGVEATPLPVVPRPPSFVFCPGCHKHVTSVARVCDRCGTDLKKHLPRSEDLRALPPSDERFGPRRAISLRVAIGLAFVILIVLLNAYRLRSGTGTRVSSSSPPQEPIERMTARVATSPEAGIKITGAGAADPGRAETVIRRDVERHLGELQQAYLATLQSSPATEGVVTLHMTLANDGSVMYLRLSPLGLAERELLTAIERQAASWRFEPSPAGLASVHYPLVFYLPRTDPRELVVRLRGLGETGEETGTDGPPTAAAQGEPTGSG